MLRENRRPYICPHRLAGGPLDDFGGQMQPGRVERRGLRIARHTADHQNIPAYPRRAPTLKRHSCLPRTGDFNRPPPECMLQDRPSDIVGQGLRNFARQVIWTGKQLCLCERHWPETGMTKQVEGPASTVSGSAKQY